LIDSYWDHFAPLKDTYFSTNENAIPILRANPDKIIWKYFCQNPNFSNLIQ
jgi:hypothetical protein